MSDLLKIARAVDGDDFFIQRIKIACEIKGKPYCRDLAIQVARDHPGGITLGDAHSMTVDTTGVTDSDIFATVDEWDQPCTDADDPNPPTEN